MMTLKDTTEAAFALFNRWIYSKTLENQAEPPADDGHVLCQLALLAVTLQVVELQNAAVCELCYIINKFKPYEPAKTQQCMESQNLATHYDISCQTSLL